jgi:hypothetical protein
MLLIFIFIKKKKCSNKLKLDVSLDEPRSSETQKSWKIFGCGGETPRTRVNIVGTRNWMRVMKVALRMLVKTTGIRW